MTRKFQTRIGERDLELMTALDQTPLTPAQLLKMSDTFQAPFSDEHTLRRRLRQLSQSGLVKSWSYTIMSAGRAPHYYKLTRAGYRLLDGKDASLPRRRYFEEVSHGRHRHTFSLAELIVRISRTAHQQGIAVRHFTRENQLMLKANGFTIYPDCAFQLVTEQGRTFNFVVELDNGTERVKTKQDVESLERKLRGYDAHQSQYRVDDPRRYIVLIVTTRSHQRLANILNLADTIMQNRQRTVFIGCDLNTMLNKDPFRSPLLTDHRHLKRTLIPQFYRKAKQTSTSLVQSSFMTSRDRFKIKVQHLLMLKNTDSISIEYRTSYISNQRIMRNRKSISYRRR